MLVQLTTATPAEAIALIGGRSCKDGRFMVDCLPVDPTYCLEGETLQIWVIPQCFVGYGSRLLRLMI